MFEKLKQSSKPLVFSQGTVNQVTIQVLRLISKAKAERLKMSDFLFLVDFVDVSRFSVR